MAATVPIISGIDERVCLVSSVDGSAVGTVGAPLSVSVSGAGSGGVSTVDTTPFVAGTSAFTATGGVFNDALAALTAAQQGESRVTPNRALHVNLRNQAGAEITSFGGVSVTDAAAWTTASSVFVPGGAVFNDSAAALTSGQQGTLRSTPNRGLHVSLRSQAGADLALTNNNAAPAALSNLGVLTALANAVPPTYVEGNQVLLSSTLDGRVRTFTQAAGTTAAGVATPAPVAVGFNGTGGLLRNFTSGLAAFPNDGNLLAGVSPGMLTIAHGSAPTNYATGVYAPPIMTKAGVPFVAVGHPNNISQSINYTGAQTNAVVIANTVGTKLVVSSILVQASAANTGNIAVGVGLAQTVTPPSGTAGRLGGSVALPAGGGFGRKTYQCGADGDQLLVTSTGTGDFTCTVEYHVTTTA